MIHRHLQHSPFPVLLVEPQGRIVQASPASLEFLGIGSRHSAPSALADIMHAEQCEAVLRAGAALTDTGFWEGECSLIGRDGQPVRAFLRVARAGDDRLVMYLRDSVGRSRSEELLRIRLQLSERARCESLDELLRSALDAAERLTDSSIGYLHVVAPDREQDSLQAWSSNTLATMCRVRGEKEHHPTRRAGIWGDCCRERTAMIHNDYAGLPHKKELPEGHPPIVRVMGLPIIHGDKVLAIIGVGNKATDYIREDADALHELASMIMDLVERKQAEAQLLASEKRFRTVFEQAAVGVALVDPLTGRFVRVNAKYGDIVGYSPEAMLTMGFQELTHPDDVAVDLECISRLLRGEVRTFTREKRYLHRNGCNVWVRLTVSPLWAEGEEPSFNIAIVEDITARKAAEAALREAKEQLELRVRERTADLEQANRALQEEVAARSQAEKSLRASESRFRRLVQMAPLPLCFADASGTLRYVNDRFTRLFGYAPEDIPTQEEWWSRVCTDGRCRGETADSWQASVQRGPNGAGDIEPAEFRVACKNGDIRLVEVSGITIEGTVLATFIDITERRLAEDELHRHRELLEELVHQRTAELKLRNMELASEIAERRRAEAALRCYTRRLTEMEEDLRKKLAAELHDEIGRDLTALNLNFSVIGNRLVQGPDGCLKARIEDTERLIEDISRTVRGLTAKLRPPVLDDYGLPAALRWHADLFSRRTGIEVTVRGADSVPRMPAEKEIALFRIVQEALTNCSKHANAGNVKVSLDHGDGRVRLSVVDDGIGFAPESASPTPAGSGWGLTIMRERAELIGGTFRLNTAPGKGTVLTVEIDEDS